jgi:hypothetical protein
MLFVLFPTISNQIIYKLPVATNAIRQLYVGSNKYNIELVDTKGLYCKRGKVYGLYSTQRFNINSITPIASGNLKHYDLSIKSSTPGHTVRFLQYDSHSWQSRILQNKLGLGYSEFVCGKNIYIRLGSKLTKFSLSKMTEVSDFGDNQFLWGISEIPEKAIMLSKEPQESSLSIQVEGSRKEKLVGSSGWNLTRCEDLLLEGTKYAYFIATSKYSGKASILRIDLKQKTIIGNYELPTELKVPLYADMPIRDIMVRVRDKVYILGEHSILVLPETLKRTEKLGATTTTLIWDGSDYLQARS